jgi:hypothetical protein
MIHDMLSYLVQAGEDSPLHETEKKGLSQKYDGSAHDINTYVEGSGFSEDATTLNGRKLMCTYIPFPSI